MLIQSLNTVSFSSSAANQKQSYSPVKISGYLSLGLGTASVIAASTHHNMLHKKLGWGAAITAILHTGLIEWRHYQRLKNRPSA